MVARGRRRGPAGNMRTLLYSHDTFGLGHLRRSRTIATALVDAGATDSALIVTGSPIAGRFDFPACVDHVRLPGVVKHADGSYTSSNLPVDIDEMVGLRSSLIDAVEESFQPDLVIVDKEPWGFRNELAHTLTAARRRGARIVLGLRDVLDAEAAVAEEWRRKKALEAIETFYDEIWVYGLPQISRPLSGVGLSRRMERQTVYTGYLRRELPDNWPAELDGELPEEPYVLVTTGGGGDGTDLIDWVLRAYEADARLPRALMIYGPFLKAADRLAFESRVARLDGRITALSFHPRVERLLANAQGIVAMGGYNTFCEILSLDRPAIICPRTRPREEQKIRAEAAERLGLARMLLPARDGESAEVMAGAIRGLATQHRPSEVSLPGLLSGLDTIVERAALAGPTVTAAAGE